VDGSHANDIVHSIYGASVYLIRDKIREKHNLKRLCFYNIRCLSYKMHIIINMGDKITLNGVIVKYMKKPKGGKDDI